MKPILLIDTSTDRGLIAIGSSEEILFQKELPTGLNQSKFLMPFLREALGVYGKKCDLSAIGVGIGPGSYTGIRVGVAVAQGLAYSWNIPLIGFSSLDGFIPSVKVDPFAAVIDARIAGAFFQKGGYGQQEEENIRSPQVCSLEMLGTKLEGINHLVTPNAKSLRSKLQKFYPENRWIWEEVEPSASTLFEVIDSKSRKGECVMPPQRLNLLYLLQTEAEREKLKRKNSTIS